MASPASEGLLQDPAEKAGLDFYFGRPTEMMRKLETSKPVRRTKAEKKSGATENGGNGEAGENQGGYLFKWQREVDDEPEEEEEDQVADAATKSRARWQVLTGNVPSNFLSVGAYFEKDGPKGKPLGREGLVNAGGVIMLQPGLSIKGGGKLNLGELSLLNETGKGAFIHDDNVLSLRSKDEIGAADLDKPPEERLVFRRHVQWPPEAPGFPPPPPDGNETVPYKRVPIQVNTKELAVRRMSRMGLKPVARQHGTFGATPESSAAEAGAPSRGAMELASLGTSTRGEGSMARTRAPSNLASAASSRELIVVKPVGSSPPANPKVPDNKKGGFLRRISFMPGLGGKKEENSAFPGVYASFVIVPYMLPPPPQPPKHPPPGSNEERRQQKQCLKKMFLEDLYSQVVELALEKIRLNDLCRDLEAQITESDAQINMLIGANDQ